jgi:hypothetical protein
MEKTNLVLAFIVRKVAIKTLVLSQNAKDKSPTPINKPKKKGESYYGFGKASDWAKDESFEPAFGLVVGGVDDFDAEA